ncbi:hypothetical protein V6Z11_D01G161300 [Gossypium hirsutum]
MAKNLEIKSSRCWRISVYFFLYFSSCFTIAIKSNLNTLQRDPNSKINKKSYYFYSKKNRIPKEQRPIEKNSKVETFFSNCCFFSSSAFYYKYIKRIKIKRKGG